MKYNELNDKCQQYLNASHRQERERENTRAEERNIWNSSLSDCNICLRRVKDLLCQQEPQMTFRTVHIPHLSLSCCSQNCIITITRSVHHNFQVEKNYFSLMFQNEISGNENIKEMN